jgi:hypothetical protein
MACNPDPEVLAPMRVMQRPKQKAKRNETKNSQKLCEKRARAQEQRGQKRAFFPRNGICEDDYANFEAN